MQKYKFVPLETILYKFNRDFRNNGISESDVIDWIVEALGFLKLPGVSEEAVRFIEVKDYVAELPENFHAVIQIAKSDETISIEEVVEEVSEEVVVETQDENCTDCDKQWRESVVPVDSDGKIIGDYDIAYYRPFFDLQWDYGSYTSSRFIEKKWTPVKLSDHSFFNSVVCKEEKYREIYSSCDDEYTIQNNQLRFSFKEGTIALSYTRQAVSPETNFPLIPDDINVSSALTYFIIWKIKEREAWDHRQGAMALAENARQKWEKYLRQAINKTKMPSTPDEYENSRNQSSYLLPNTKSYNSFFGDMSKPERRRFKTFSRRRLKYNIG